MLRQVEELNQTSSFQMPSFSKAVSGVVYDGKQIKKGMPLGGLGTGYVCLNGNGALGRHTIFTNFNAPTISVPEYNVPFLFLESDQHKIALTTESFAEWQPVEHIRMWGHFPAADMTFDTALPLDISLSAYSSFIPGDIDESNIPAAVFQLHLKNTGTEPIRLKSTFAFPGIKSECWPHLQRKGNYEISRQDQPDHSGTTIRLHAGGQNSNVDFNYYAGVMSKQWAYAAQPVSHPLAEDIGPSVFDHTSVAFAVEMELKPQEEINIPYVLAWYSAYWYTYDSHPHQNRYSQKFSDSVAVAKYVEEHHVTQYKKIIGWQEAIYESDYPAWLQDLLVNSLYSLTKNSFLFINPRSDSWFDSEGLFTHNESFDGCCLQETMVCRMHGHFPLLFLFPKLERTTLEAFKYYQLASGEVPFALGMGTGIEAPVYRRQHPINTSEFIQMIYRYYKRTGDEQMLRDYYPTVRSGILFMLTLDDDGDGLVNDHPYALPGTRYPANQFYDIWPWYGTSAYVAGIWLSALKTAEAMAAELGMDEDREAYRAMFEKGIKAYLEKLWNGKYLRLYNQPETGLVDETCLANQMMLEWCNHVSGLESILPPEMITSILQTVDQWNASATDIGMVNGYHPEGKLDDNDHAKMVFIGEIWCACMTFMYKDEEQRGAELAEEIYQALVQHGLLWDQYCILNPEDGSPVWGKNYYSNLVAWALPMAYNRESIEQFSQGQMLKKILSS